MKSNETNLRSRESAHMYTNVPATMALPWNNGYTNGLNTNSQSNCVNWGWVDFCLARDWWELDLEEGIGLLSGYDEEVKEV